MCSQHPGDRGVRDYWYGIINILSGEAYNYVARLSKKQQALTREARFCLKYCFSTRKEGKVIEVVKKRTALCLSRWYWRWKIGWSPKDTGTSFAESVLMEQIVIPNFSGRVLRRPKGAGALISAMVSQGLLQRWTGTLEEELALTPVGKDLRDIVLCSPRLDRIKVIGEKLGQRFRLRILPWWDLIREVDPASKDELLGYEYCPCGSGKRYEKCCKKEVC